MPCEYCGKFYSTRSSLHGHKRKRHPIKLKHELRRKMQERLRRLTSSSSAGGSDMAGIIDDYRYRSSLFNAVSRALQRSRKESLQLSVVDDVKTATSSGGDVDEAAVDERSKPKRRLTSRQQRVTRRHMKSGNLTNLGLDHSEETNKDKKTRLVFALASEDEQCASTAESEDLISTQSESGAKSEEEVEQSPRKTRRQRSIAQIANTLASHARFVSRSFTAPLFQPLPSSSEDTAVEQPLDLSIKSSHSIASLKSSFAASSSHLEQVREIPYYAH